MLPPKHTKTITLAEHFTTENGEAGCLYCDMVQGFLTFALPWVYKPEDKLIQYKTFLYCFSFQCLNFLQKASRFLPFPISIGFFTATLDGRPSRFLRTSWILLAKILLKPNTSLLSSLAVLNRFFLTERFILIIMLAVTFLFLPVLFLDGYSSVISSSISRTANCFLTTLGTWPKCAMTSVVFIVFTPSCSQDIPLNFSSGEIFLFLPHHLLATNNRWNWESGNGSKFRLCWQTQYLTETADTTSVCWWHYSKKFSLKRSTQMSPVLEDTLQRKFRCNYVTPDCMDPKDNDHYNIRTFFLKLVTELCRFLGESWEVIISVQYLSQPLNTVNNRAWELILSTTKNIPAPQLKWKGPKKGKKAFFWKIVKAFIVNQPVQLKLKTEVNVRIYSKNKSKFEKVTTNKFFKRKFALFGRIFFFFVIFVLVKSYSMLQD